MHYEENEKGILVPKHEIHGVGKYTGRIIRAGEVIDEFEYENLVTNEGLNYTLNVALFGATQLSAWYLGIFSGNYTPAATDTAATLPGNSTESSAYTSSTRPTWTQVAATGQSITNSAARAAFTFNATATIYGAFLVSSATIGGTSGTSFSAARFSTSKNVVALDELLLTYTFSASSS